MELLNPGNQTRNINLQILYKKLKDLRIPEKWWSVTFSQIQIPANLNKGQKLKFEELLCAIENLDIYKCEKVITFSSKSNGVGKTHLLFCLFKKYIWECIINENAVSAKFGKEYDFFLEIYETYKNDFSKTEKDVIEDYTIKSKLLAMDDLFATKDNEFGRQKIFTLIDKRADYLGYPTIFTTNLSLEEINTIDSRIASRMDNEYFFDFSGLSIDFRKYRL